MDNPTSQIIMYQTESGRTKIEVRLQDETVWLTQKLMAELFQTTPQNITLHLNNIYQDGELGDVATCKEFLQVQSEGQRSVQRKRKFYNLDAIIAVGYRVRSHRGTQFRRWATGRLREYVVKGFVLDDERLKQGRNLGSDYFDELLERIRDIRASEQRFYQKICDIYKLNERNILQHAGKITRELALAKAESEYEKFNRKRILEKPDNMDDFDIMTKQIDAAKKS